MHAVRRHKGRFLIAAGAALLVVLLGAPPALANFWSPEKGGSPNANDLNTVYRIVLYIGAVIFVIVEGTLIWSLVRYRARRRDAVPPQVHGNTPLEVGWTIAAGLVLVAITAVTFSYLGAIKNPPNSSAGGLQQAAHEQFAVIGQPPPPSGKALHINVNGQQYIWRFEYLDAPKLTENRPVYSYYELVVPINTTVTLRINSSDVDHSWWIPKLGGKADAIPGHTNETWFRISKPGLYRGQCAELCGEGHADMRAVVRAVPADQYNLWVEQQRANILAAQKALAAQRKARGLLAAGGTG